VRETAIIPYELIQDQHQREDSQSFAPVSSMRNRTEALFESMVETFDQEIAFQIGSDFTGPSPG
jgi:hypothetical protein